MPSVDFDTIYIFGDSYSDTGASDDQRTNGGTAASYLAASFGSELAFPDDPDIGTKSINFAETSARVGTQTANGPTSLTNQVNDFSQLVGSGEASFDSEDTMFFLAGGLNDRNTPNSTLVSAYTQQVAELVSLGAQYIQIALLPTAIPRYTERAERINPSYIDLVEDLNALYSNVSITLSQWGAYFDDIINNPSTYGFVNVTDAYLDDPTPDGTADEYFYYFDSHPSDAAHQIVGARLAQEAQTIPVMPPLPDNDLLISGDVYGVSSFAQQNGASDFEVSQDGLTLELGTNAWVEAQITGDIVVTRDTVLQFDFFSTNEGEMHGVEFDNNDRATGNRGFQLFGEQGGFYRQTYNDYELGDGVKTYVIEVGKFFRGTFDSIVFFTDDDVEGGSNSTFSNIKLFEPNGSDPDPVPTGQLSVSGKNYSLSSFDQQNPDSDYAVTGGGTTLELGTNAWAELEIPGNFRVTSNTVLRFDFSSTDEGEMHGFEFDRNDRATDVHGFQLFGEQTGFYRQDFNNYALNDGVKSYEIAVGQFFTGRFDNIVFFTDDDALGGSNSVFSNIELIDIA